jgi:hypothetical protein
MEDPVTTTSLAAIDELKTLMMKEADYLPEKNTPYKTLTPLPRLKTARRARPPRRTKPKEKSPRQVMCEAISKALTSDAPHMPKSIREATAEVAMDRSMSDALFAVMERKNDFPSKMAAIFAGVGLNEKGREHVDKAIDRESAANRENELGMRKGSRNLEVVIGGGLHAAIYCAVRVAQGGKPPIVYEGSERVGGAFAVSQRASFFLNSRNRPGELSLPGLAGGALNVLPAAPFQPSDLSNDEYQRNSDLAWVIRTTLAMNAKLVTGARFDRYSSSYGLRERPAMYYKSGALGVFSKRMVNATGLGEPRSDLVAGTGVTESDRYMTFMDFMRRMDEPFPLRGMDRVAVIGAGDSGRTAVEALVGQGPSSGWSVASVDRPTRIDWYGCEENDREGWEKCNRSRYRGIGREFAREGETDMSAARLRSAPKAESIRLGYRCLYVNGFPYTHVIDCTGFTRRSWETGYGFETYSVSGRVVARRNALGVGEAYLVGPRALIDLSNEDVSAVPAYNDDKANAEAIFRYAKETATFAATIGDVL